MRIRRATLTMLASLTCVSAVVGVAGPASAAEVAPGAPMHLFPPIPAEVPQEIPTEVFTQYCSQGVPGTVILPDGSRKDVMVTAGHCLWGIEGVAEIDPEVYAPLREGRQLIAVRDQGRAVHPALDDRDPEELRLMYDGDDWATADLVEGVEMTRVADSVDQFGQSHGEPVVLTGVRDYTDLEPWDVSFDNLGQPICKDGQTSGRTCGVQVLRSSNGLWYLGLALGGDSGGVNFDPQTGEALGVTSMSVYGVVGRAQPLDVALEEAYGIPDGQVNDYFALPDSTAEHSDMLTLSESEAVSREWAVDTLTQEMATPEEAAAVTQANAETAAQELRGLAEDSVSAIIENPGQAETIIQNAESTADSLESLAHDTADTVLEAGLGTALQQLS